RSAALLATAYRGDDAVGALGVAAHRDLDPGLERALAVGGQVPREVLVRPEAATGDPVPAGAHPVGEMRYRAGPERDVDKRIELEDPLPLGLCVTTAAGDHQLRVLALTGARVPQIRGEPRVGLLPDRARVEHDDVGFVGGRSLADAERLQHS